MILLLTKSNNIEVFLIILLWAFVWFTISDHNNKKR
jgi:hypothetical protein